MVTLLAFVLASFVIRHDPLHDAILDAICEVETRGGVLLSNGDGGRSLGPFQIQRSYWQDALEFDPSLGGEYEDCRRRPYAEKVVRAYMLRHAPHAWHAGDAEVIARTHNGGPRGAARRSTLGYWGKVAKSLKSSGTERAAPERGEAQPFGD